MYLKRLFLLTSYIVLLCMLSCNGPAAENKETDAAMLAATHNLSPAFWDYAVSSNMLQTELGQLASEKGITPQVKQWGKEAAAYHTVALKKLKAIGEGHDAIVLPDSLGNADKAMVKEFSNLDSILFDTRYLQHLRISYKTQMQRYQDALKKTESPKLVSWLTDMQQHLNERLQEIAKADSVQTTGVSK